MFGNFAQFTVNYSSLFQFDLAYLSNILSKCVSIVSFFLSSGSRAHVPIHLIIMTQLLHTVKNFKCKYLICTANQYLVTQLWTTTLAGWSLPTGKKGKGVCLQSNITESSLDLTSIKPRNQKSLFNSLILPGENAAHFLQLKPFTQYQYFVPPGAHCCWVATCGVDSKFAQGVYK